jgi:hypothetical protein
MSALGQKQTLPRSNGMSALPPKADMTGLEARTGSSLMDCDAAIVVQLKVCSLAMTQPGEMPVAQSSAMASVFSRQPRA